MEKLTRRRYTLEYKQEAVRLVSSGQKVAAAAKALGIVEQTLANWVEAERGGPVAWAEQRAAQRGADGEQPSAGGAGAGDDGARHSGKSHGVLREGAAMKYAWIEKNKLRWPVCVQCRVLGVSAVGISSAPGATEEDPHPPPSERDGFAGRNPRSVRRSARGLWLAPRVAATEGGRSARGQAAGRVCDAAERSPRPRQAAFSRAHHRQQPCSAHRAPTCSRATSRWLRRTPSGPAT